MRHLKIAIFILLAFIAAVAISQDSPWVPYYHHDLALPDAYDDHHQYTRVAGARVGEHQGQLHMAVYPTASDEIATRNFVETQIATSEAQFGNVVYVSPPGCIGAQCFTTIGSALAWINAQSPGPSNSNRFVVQLMPGNYAEDIPRNDFISFNGLATGVAITGSCTPDNIMVDLGQGLTFSNITVKPTCASKWAGIDIEDGTEIKGDIIGSPIAGVLHISGASSGGTSHTNDEDVTFTGENTTNAVVAKINGSCVKVLASNRNGRLALISTLGDLTVWAGTINASLGLPVGQTTRTRAADYTVHLETVSVISLYSTTGLGLQPLTNGIIIENTPLAGSILENISVTGGDGGATSRGISLLGITSVLMSQIIVSSFLWNGTGIWCDTRTAAYISDAVFIFNTTDIDGDAGCQISHLSTSTIVQGSGGATITNALSLVGIPDYDILVGGGSADALHTHPNYSTTDEYATTTTELELRAHKVILPMAGDLACLDSLGDLADCMYAPGYFQPSGNYAHLIGGTVSTAEIAIDSTLTKSGANIGVNAGSIGGAGSANKIAQLNNSGLLNTSLIPDLSGVYETVIALASWVGSGFITTLGTITTGAWHGSVVEVPYGGTGLNTGAVYGSILYWESVNSLYALAPNITTTRKFPMQVGNNSTVTGWMWDVVSDTDITASSNSIANYIPRAKSTGKIDVNYIPLGTTAGTVTEGNDSRLSVTGKWVARTYLMAGTSFTTNSKTNTTIITVQAGGGGGGGAYTTSNIYSVGVSGSSGGYAEKTFTVTPSTAYTYAIGAAGTGGVGAADGGAGGNTTFTVDGVTVTTYGGLGGTYVVAGSGAAYRLGTSAGAVSVNGDINSAGSPTTYAIRGPTVDIVPPAASSMFGGGANGAIVVAASSGNGIAATGYGSGGSGAYIFGQTTTKTGGAGSAGLIIVEEYQ